MTTVRHETVHYTAEEMAAKEAADTTAKVKKQKAQLIWCGIVTLAIAFSCVACLLMGALGNG